MPEEAVLEMKANFKLPDVSDPFIDDVMWIELQREEAQRLVDMSVLANIIFLCDMQ